MIPQKIKTFFPYLIILILVWWLLAKGCKEKPLSFSEPRIVFKDRIITLVNESDSTKSEVKKQDVIRIKQVIKWRDRVHDTVFKECEELILICDTIIKIDSTQISTLKHVVTLSDSIIATQKIMLRNDSLDITGLKKSLKKQKRKTGLAVTGLIIVGAAAILK
jgi:hypothetical protein